MTFQLLQTLSSDDLSTAFRLMGRDVLEIARYLTGDRAVVLGGLELEPTATGVTVQPGALLQPYAGLVSPPRDDESLTVFGRLGDPVALTVPPLGVNTWYLVEGRAAEVDDFGTRLIQDQTTKVQTPQSVVVSRSAALLVRARVGTASAPPAAAAGWVPLGAVLRRTTGAVLAGDIEDRRPTLEDPDELAEETFERHDYAITKLNAGATIDVDIALIDREGHRLSARGTFVCQDLLAAGYAPPAKRWQYLYLVNPNPEGAAPLTPSGRGVLVLSGVEPIEQGSRTPSAAIPLPAVWGVASTTRATCVGALYSEPGTADNYTTQSCVRGRLSAIGDTRKVDGILLSPWQIFPRNARRVDFLAKWTGPRAEDAGRSVDLYAPGDTPDPADAPFYAYGEIPAGTKGSQCILPNLYVRGVDYKNIRFELDAGADPMDGTYDGLYMHACDF